MRNLHTGRERLVLPVNSQDVLYIFIGSYMSCHLKFKKYETSLGNVIQPASFYHVAL